jgi:two-component system, OmpR family, sensor histidine kinase QseC
VKWVRPLNSLQSRLLALALGLVTAVWLGAALLTWAEAQHELDELLDSHLAQAAALLVAQQAKTDDDGDDDDGVADAPSLHKYAPKVAFQVFHKGVLLTHSANAGAKPMSARAQGFDTVRLAGGTEWRVFVARGIQSGVQVFVAEQTQPRDAILWAVMRSLLLPLAFSLPLLVLALWWAVRRGLAPLRQLSQELGQRRARSLEPVQLADMPREMQPMVQSLNGLFKRIEHMVDSERRFTADAAHELRTPIAAVRAQAQVALGAGSDMGQREHALRATLAGCDRATRLVEQLLTLSRLDAAQAATWATVDLGVLVQRLAAEAAPASLVRHQVLELDADANCMVRGDETLVNVLVRNLIDNALRYSPDGAQVWVSVAMQGGQAVLRVQDSGPGMTEPEMARLGERFFRVLGNDRTGSGLGWSIVKRLADVFGAKVTVGRSMDLGGLAVSLTWPAVMPPPREN